MEGPTNTGITLSGEIIGAAHYSGCLGHDLKACPRRWQKTKHYEGLVCGEEKVVCVHVYPIFFMIKIKKNTNPT
jgi:hypothetical protein